MMIALQGMGDDSLLVDLEAARIPYERYVPPRGRIAAAAGDLIVIAPGAATMSAIATVLANWVRSRASRQVIISTTHDRAVYIDEQMASAEMERLLSNARNIMAVEAEPF